MGYVYDEALGGFYNTETGQVIKDRPQSATPLFENPSDAEAYAPPMQYNYKGKTYTVDSPNQRPVIDLGNNTGVYLKVARDPETQQVYFTGEEEFIPDMNAFNAKQNEFSFSDIAPVLALGGGLFGLGALGGLGAEAGAGANSLYGLELGGEGVGVGASSVGAGTGSGGLSWLGNSGLSSISDAVSSMGSGATGVAGTAGTAASYSPGAILDAAATAAASGGGSAASLIPGFTNAQLLSGGMQLVGGLLSGSAGQDAANTSANAQLEAARIAADAAKFRPVGVTTRFGSSNFTKDANGNVIGAGYTLSPELKAQQDQLMASSNGLLGQFTGSQLATAPMATAAQTMFGLGQGYLATDPQAQAAKYLADQQALLAAGRERDLTSLENRLLSQGRLGLATGGTSTGMMAANPEMEALRNAQKQQDLALAAQATQGGMDYAKFGAGMVGSGGDMLTSMYNTQSAAYKPYQTAIQGAQYLEGLGQQPLTLGMDIGRQVTAGSAASGGLLAQGMTNAAQTQQAGSYSPWGTALMAGGNMLGTMTQPQQQAAQQAQQQLTQQQMLNPGSFFPTSNVNNMGSEWNWRGLWS